MRDLVVLSGSSNPELTLAICERLGIVPGNVRLSQFSNLETNVTIVDSVRGRDVYIVQSACGAVNDRLMELLIMVSACRMASARKITVVLPLFPYSRQPDGPYKRNGMPLGRLSSEACAKLAALSGGIQYTRSPSPPFPQYRSTSDPPSEHPGASPTSPVLSESAAPYKLWTARPGTLIAEMLEASGAQHVITLDLHHPQYQGFFSIPVDNLMSLPLVCKCITERIPGWRDAVIVSPDAGGAKRASAIADALHIGLVLIHKERRDASSRVTLVGEVTNKVCVIVDDLADTCSTLTRAAGVLRHYGASNIHGIVTHGVFSAGAIDRVNASTLDSMIVSNSVPQSHHLAASPKLKCFDIAPLVAEAIRRNHNGESVSFLFDLFSISDMSAEYTA